MAILAAMSATGPLIKTRYNSNACEVWEAIPEKLEVHRKLQRYRRRSAYDGKSRETDICDSSGLTLPLSRSGSCC